MSERLFIEVLNMSLTGSVVILAVLAVRPALRRFPGIFSYMLWAVVLFRLLCPVSFTADLSLLGALKNDPASHGHMEYIPADMGYQAEPYAGVPVPALNEAVSGSLPAGDPAASVNFLPIVLYVLARIWLLGIAVILICGIVSVHRLRKRLRTAVRDENFCGERIYRAQGYGTAFVYGFFRPIIYLPSNLGEEEETYILLHERIHIRRGDHIFRLLGYFALCIHWFNPLVWAAFCLSGRDMEMSCDEAVIRRAGSQVKKKYSASLLAMAAGDAQIKRGIPIAFGEGDTRYRVKNILHYKKPAVFLAGAGAILCAVLAVALLANPGRGEQGAKQDNVLYGIVGYEDAEGETLSLIVRIPRMGDILIPEADEISPYIEIDFDGLEAGDLVRITFPENEEIMVMDSYPGRFAGKAKKIEVMGRGFFAMDYLGEDRYRFTVPLGMAPEARQGDMLHIYHYVPGTDGQETELLASVPVQEVYEDNYRIWVELSVEEVETFLSEFGFGITCTLEKAADVAEPGETADDRASLPSEFADVDPNHIEDGAYTVCIRSLSRSAYGIERYVTYRDMEDGELPFLAFSGDCVFMVNWGMDSLDYQETDFDTFAALVDSAGSYINPSCYCTFQNGLIVQAQLKSAWYEYGISYVPFVRDTWYGDLQDILEMPGDEVLDTYYTLSGTEHADIGESEGTEIIQIYTGNIGDGDSGVILFWDEAGNLLYSDGAHAARAGWNNVYLGEAEGSGFLMRVHIEDRDTYGEYGYQVFRLGHSGEILQIAGSSFTFDNGNIPYHDKLFQEWAEGMSYYLEKSRLLLSTQEGEIRTDGGSEADKYNYETLRRKL